MTTLNLEASKKVYELLGEYETEDFEEEVREPWVVCIPLLDEIERLQGENERLNNLSKYF